MGEFQPDYSKQPGENETWRVDTGSQELVESTEIGPDGKVYRVKRTRNASGGFSETKEVINTVEPQASGGDDIPKDPLEYKVNSFGDNSGNLLSDEELAKKAAAKTENDFSPENNLN